MSDHVNMQVEPHNLTWLSLPKSLAYLRISAAHGVQYAYLVRPSDTLAQHALWEAVMAYADEWHGSPSAPPLLIECASD